MIVSDKSVSQLQWMLSLSLVIVATFIECKPISDGFSSPPSEELYNYRSHQGHYDPRGESYPSSDSYRDVEYHYQPHNFYPRGQAVAHSEPDVAPFQNDRYYQQPAGYGYGESRRPLFQQGMMTSSLLDNPLKKMLDKGKEQVEQSMQQMDAAGKKMGESAQKDGDKIGKQMQAMMEGGEDAGDGEQPIIPPPPGIPMSPDARNLNKKDPKEKEGDKKGETGTEGDEKEGEKDKEPSSEGDDGSTPMKKLAEAGNDMMKKIPDAMVMPKMPKSPIKLFSRIRDETSEAHGYDEDVGEWPRAERAEWGTPDIYDVRMHPRADYFDYYDGPY